MEVVVILSVPQYSGYRYASNKIIGITNNLGFTLAVRPK